MSTTTRILSISNVNKLEKLLQAATNNDDLYNGRHIFININKNEELINVKCANCINPSVCNLTKEKCYALDYFNEYLSFGSYRIFIIPPHCPLIHNQKPYKSFPVIVKTQPITTYKKTKTNLTLSIPSTKPKL